MIRVLSWVVGFALSAGLLFGALTPVQAIECPPGTVDSKVTGGIISSRDFGTSSQRGFTSDTGCVADIGAFIDLNQAEVRLDNFNSLWARYYEQSTYPKVSSITGLTSITNGTLYYTSENLTVNTTPLGQGVGIVFVRGNLFITGDINYQDGVSTSGLLFIVKGNVYISPNVAKITAVVISEGDICSNAQSDGQCRSNTKNTPRSVDRPLLVKGNLISLSKDTNPATPHLQLVRDLFGSGGESNAQRAEIVQIDPKYFVILKDLLSHKLTYTSENSNYALDIESCDKYNNSWRQVGSRCKDELGYEERECPANTTGERHRPWRNPISCLACTVSVTSSEACVADGQDDGSKSFVLNYYDILGRPTGDLSGTFTPSTGQPGVNEPFSAGDNSSPISYSGYTSGIHQAQFSQNDSNDPRGIGENTTCLSDQFTINQFASCPAGCHGPTSVNNAECSALIDCPSTIKLNNKTEQCSSCQADGSFNTYFTGTCNADGTDGTATCPFPANNYNSACQGCSETIRTYYDGTSCTPLACGHNYPTVPTLASCTTDGCTSPSGGSQSQYATGSSCSLSNCALSSTYTSQCNGCSAIARTYHDENSCGELACPNNFATTPPLSSCSADGCSSVQGGTRSTYSSGNSCTSNDASCPLVSTQSSQCAGCSLSPRYYHDGSSCGQLTCPANLPPSTVDSCPADGCSSEEGGTPALYTSGTSCAQNDSGCQILSTYTNKCSGCSLSPRYYHDGSSCGQLTCPTNAPSGQPLSLCPPDGCTSGDRASYADGTSCSPTPCPLSSTFATQCGGCSTTARFYHDENSCGDLACPTNTPSSTASSCPADGCTSPTGGSRYQYYTGSSCSLSDCPLASSFASQCNGCASATRYYHDGNSCGQQTCPNNFPVTPSSSICTSDGCSSPSGGGSTLTYASGTTCAANDRTCRLTSSYDRQCKGCSVFDRFYHDGNSCGQLTCPHNYVTAPTSAVCTPDGCTAVTGGTRITYASGTSCSGSDSNCPLVSTEPTQCNGCSSATRYYHDGNSCGQQTCSNKYPANNQASACAGCSTSPRTYYTGSACSPTGTCDNNYTPPTGPVASCRTTGFNYSNGSQCGYTYYPANCGSGVCGGNGCLVQSRIRATLSGDCGNTQWWWQDEWSNGATTNSSSWYSNSCNAHSFQSCDDGYSTDHHGWSNSYLNDEMLAHLNQDGIAHIQPPLRSGSCSDHGGSCNFDWNNTTCVCVGCAPYSNP